MLTRRLFVRRAIQTTAVLSVSAAGSVGYGFWEASHIRVRRRTIPVRNLPDAFQDKTIGVLADLHHGPYVGIDFIRDAVKLANDLKPDLFALVGDYSHRVHDKAEIDMPPCLDALSELRAPLGVFAVPGNHDMYKRGALYQELVAASSLHDLTNRHQEVICDGRRLFVAGVDDHWWGRPDQKRALRGITQDEAIILLAHNPDFAEERPDDRVGLVLSGHTHGGQIYVPAVGAPWIPSRYGAKYRSGLVAGPASNVFVSRGLGEAGVPLRFRVPPEINVLTLKRA